MGLSDVDLQSFKNGVKLFGFGRWTKLNHVGLLPGRGTADYVEISQRFLKQQSLSALAGLHLDMDKLRAHNEELIRELQESPDKARIMGLLVRNGVLVNVGGQLTTEEVWMRLRLGIEFRWGGGVYQGGWAGEQCGTPFPLKGVPWD